MKIAQIRKLVQAQCLGFRPARVFVVYLEATQVVNYRLVVDPNQEHSLPTQGHWRWRLIAPSQHRPDKQIVGGSGERFDTKSNAIRAARTEASYYAANKAAVVVLE